MDVKRGGYYSWLNRRESKRAIENKKMANVVKETHAKTKEAYGLEVMLKS